MNRACFFFLTNWITAMVIIVTEQARTGEQLSDHQWTLVGIFAGAATACWRTK